MWLPVMMEATSQVTEQAIRQTFLWLIQQEIEAGNDPWQQITEAELREADWGEMPLEVTAPAPEQMNDPQELDSLVDALMATQEVQTAVRWLKGLNAEEAKMGYQPWSVWTDPETGEEYDMEQPTLMEALHGIILTEHDSGAGVGLFD